MIVFALLLLPPLLAAVLAALVRPYRPFVGWVTALLSLAPLGAAVALWARALQGDVLTAGPGEFLRADGLSVLLALCVSFVAGLAAWLGPGLAAEDGYHDPERRSYRVYSNLFAFTMLLAVTTHNVGVMWVAIEATTITSAMLVPLHVTKASVEASWKYILIGSVGIALAFVGTVLGYFDFVNLAGEQASALNWTVLVASAPSLHAEVLKLAFVFILIGYGTKAGLAPMHTWLPDAHSESPSPLSAMMSGVLLGVAIYAIVRWKTVVDAAVGPAFTDRLLIALSLVSLVISAFSLIAQRNYKRMLAYSSIEHTGLTCLGLALGPLGVFAAMLHMVNHAVAKSMMFLLAGRVQQRYQTTGIAQVAGLARVMPVTAGFFAAGMFAIVGLPPFGLFISEFALVRAGFAAGRGWLMGLVLLLLVVAFVALVRHLNRMLYGAPPDATPIGEREPWALVPLGLCLLILLALGLLLPSPVSQLLDQVVEITTQ
ncbi:MAG TPA: proton-conducting transporter membrane subunit [Methylomirabilota bacterium]|nr:proton-conducting transporter membrane subunit [Methylomirabilota bacterium]